MEPIWIVVASRSGAQLLETRNMLSAPRVVEVMENPEGRLKPSEIYTDGPGIKTQGGATPRHTTDETVTDTVARRFARDIARRLDEARGRGEFEHLVLISAPGFLGYLRDELSKETGRRVISSTAKDFASEPDIRTRVQAVVRDVMQFTV